MSPRAFLPFFFLASLGCGNVLGISDFSEGAAQERPTDADEGGDAERPPTFPPEIAEVAIFGSSGHDELQHFAGDSLGRMLLLGQLGGEASFGGDVLAGNAFFVAALDGEGAHRFSASVTSDDAALAGAATSTEGSAVVGSYASALELRGQAAPSPVERDGFILLISDDGATTTLVRLGGPGEQRATSVAVDAAGGSVLVAGTTAGGVEELALEGDSGQSFLAKMTLDGSLVWSQGWPGNHQPSTLVVSDDGTIHVAGTSQSLDQLFEALAIDDGPSGGGAFLVRLAADGAVIDARAFSNVDRLQLEVMRIEGAIHLAGAFEGSLQLGAFDATSPSEAGSQDVFIAELSSVDLEPAWLSVFGGAERERVHALASDGSQLIAGGHFASATLDLGDDTAEQQGRTDAFSVALAADGAPSWGFGFGGTGDDDIRGLRISGDMLTAAGNITAPIELEGKSLEVPGKRDIFIARVPLQR